MSDDQMCGVFTVESDRQCCCLPKIVTSGQRVSTSGSGLFVDRLDGDGRTRRVH